jgi:hypothetical protein
MKPYMLFFVLFSLVSCLKKDKTTVDSIITDATIYTVNSFDKATAISVMVKYWLLVQMMRSLINLSLTIPSMLRVSLCIRA